MPYPQPGGTSRIGAVVIDPIKQAIASEVAAVFNDRSKGERPVTRRTDGLFGPSSVAWRVHGDVASMMVGGIAGLLLQMLHPSVLAGVWDHSKFRDDMDGRLRRTARFIALTTYGSAEEASAAIERVRRIHAHVRGILPSGEPYWANDPASLAWVHVTETTTFLDGWVRYAERRMTLADQNRYFAEMAQVGSALGADPVPRSRAEARRLLNDMRPLLRSDERSREIVDLLLHRPSGNPLHRLTTQSGVDLLPDWARRMHGLSAPFAPLVRAGTAGVARTLRWAFA